MAARQRHHPTIGCFVGLATIGFFSGCATPRFPASRNEVVTNLHASDYSSQSYELWMCALKGLFCGDIHYVGSDRQFDYFRVGGRRGFFRVTRRASALNENRRFEVGKGTPFTVGTSDSPYWTPAIPHP